MRTLSLLAALLLAAACASHETQAPSASNDSNAGRNPASTAGSGTAQPSNSSAVNGNATADAGPPGGSVYFDFDSNDVKTEFQPVIESETRYLSAHPGAKLRIEGNCDERGSREYNLALGQRRAEAVKHVMTVLGANGTHIETVSFGEEKPAAEGHDESAWARNRRDDFRYVSR
ncbi:MAG TPA: peptidoglycan-associated lipoprotein Pal [Usitatibacter sp.]|jgi:peptidoglycan-associated lipoprotein|nr:peptidoglycan-associated lipoprotein Pal [Usitatibacter sp.]